MKKEKIFFGAGIIWEIIRFLFFFLLITFVFFKPFIGEINTILWLLFLGSCQLLMPAGYTLLFFNSTKFDIIIQLLRIGKVLNIFPSLFIFIDEILINNTLFSIPLTSLSLFKKAGFFFLSISIFFDLIFLYFLLSYKGKGKKTDELKFESAHLPEYTITEVKNDFYSESTEE